MERTCIVAIRKIVPKTIRTNGPARERRRGGGGTIGGTPGVITGLDIFHLARRRWLRTLHCSLHCRRRRGARRKARRSRRRSTNVSCIGRIPLHQLDVYNHQKNGGPSSAKAHARNAV